MVVHRARRSEQGSATIEMAILTPLLLLLLLGASDFARIYRTQMALGSAAYSAAQYGARSKLSSGDIAGMIDKAKKNAKNIANPTASAARSCKCGGGTSSCASVCANGSAPEIYVEVAVSSTFETALKYPGIPTSIPLSQTSTMRVE
jgi:Flp pilus assembly protein TadG